MFIEEERLHIEYIATGYDEETLAGKRESSWEDVPLHQAFMQHSKHHQSFTLSLNSKKL